MTLSRILAFMLIVITASWFVWGYVKKSSDAQTPVTPRLAQQGQSTLFKVGVVPVSVEPHSRRLTLSGRTEADKRASAIARATGTIVRMNIKRGSVVKEGDVLIELSDEAREASVKKAQARLQQRQDELKARLKLIAQGNFPAINKTQLEAELREAEASLAQANAEFERGRVLAPISGIVNEVPVEIGQTLQIGQTIADIISPDPMLAVAEIAEKQLNDVRVGTLARVRLITGQTFESTVRFISAKSNAQTRTYRLEVGINNKDGTVSDGITAEVIVSLQAVQSAQIPRSALTFGADGRLGVRTVDEANTVQFMPVTLLDDGAETLQVSGLKQGQRLIVQGQDFVKEGAIVEPVPPIIATGS
jgi:multidrug efflux system membrane fusion protein